MSEVSDDYKNLAFTNAAEFFAPKNALMPSDKEIEAAWAVLERVKEATELIKKWTVLKCPCGHVQTLAVSTYVQTLWYTEPHGCTEGDNWNHGEGQVVCGGCNKRMRLNFKCSELQHHEYRAAFKEVLTCYD